MYYINNFICNQYVLLKSVYRVTVIQLSHVVKLKLLILSHQHKPVNGTILASHIYIYFFLLMSSILHFPL